MHDGEGWEILPIVAVRATGFPIEDLHQLRYPCTTRLALSILAHEVEMAALRHTLLTSEFPQAVACVRQHGVEHRLLAKLSACRHAVGYWTETSQLEETCQQLQTLPGLLDRWNALFHSRQQLEKLLTQTWETEHAARRQTLRRLGAQTKIQEAIYLSNPSVYASLQRYLSTSPAGENSATRKFERRLVSYLQRFCTKNETQSFFGPINYATLAPDQPEVLQLRYASETLQQRCAFPSQWMVEAMAAAISAEPELRFFLRPRRATHCLLGENYTLTFPMSSTIRVLDAQQAWLFEHADGRRTVRELAQASREDCLKTWQRLEQLQRWAAIVLPVLIPGDTSDPLGYLQNWLANVPESPARTRWQTTLHQLHTLIEKFAATPFPQRTSLLDQMEILFTSACGQKAHRGAGAMYVDRSLLFEECLGNLEQCSIGGSLAHQLTHKLQPILNLWYVYGHLQMQRDQRIAYQLWQRLRTSSTHTVPLLAYLHAAQNEIEHSVLPGEDETATLLQRLRTLVSCRSDGHIARLSYTDLPRAPVEHAYTSLDVMIASERISALQQGNYQIILGEGHALPLLLVFPTAHFLEEEQRDALKRAFSAKITAPDSTTITAQVLVTRKNKIFPYMLTDSQIELRPFYSDTRAIPVAAVEVYESAGTLALRAEGRDLRLHTSLKRLSEQFDPLAPFAFPGVRPPTIDLGEHTPRIEVDGIVCQRERWTLPTTPIKTQGLKGCELFLKVWRWKELHGLPQEVFVRAPHEPKPIYIDFCNYFLHELLCRMADGCDFLVLSEMLPHSQQLWLGQENEHYSCELRMIAVHDN